MAYADNLALGFFKKQGFTSVTAEKLALWKDTIKEY